MVTGTKASMQDRKRRLRRRRARTFVVLVTVLALLVGVTIAVDRWLVRQAEDQVKKEAASASQASFSNLDVDINAFPFLFQLARRDLEHVHITADSVTLHNSAEGAGDTDPDTDSVQIDNFVMDLHGVNIKRPIVAHRVSGHGTLPVSLLDDYLRQAGYSSIDMRVGEANTLVFSMDVMGMSLAVTTAVSLAPTGRAIVIELKEADLGGFFNMDLSDVLPEATTEVPLDQLPASLKLTSLNVTDRGIKITFEGEDVPLRQMSN